MKKLLIIGGSILQLPAIKKAKELGFYVGVADFNPKAIGVQFADKYYEVSTIDITGVTSAAKEFMPNGIMTLATDMPMRSVAAACEELGLPGISRETAITATDKGEMINAFSQNGVACPWFHVVPEPETYRQVLSKITFPCVFKPTDNAGSRGVVLVNSLQEADAAYAYSQNESRGGGVIIEEYMRGYEVSVEIMVIRGVVHVLAVTDKLTTGAPHFVEMGHSQPSRLDAENVARIEDLACRAVKAVGIKTGPAHVEIMLTKDGPKMIELGARMGGDCITTHLVPLSTGIDMVAAAIHLACGEPTDIEPKFSMGSAIRYFDVPGGVISAIDGLEIVRDMAGVHDIVFTKCVGETVTKISSSADRVGYVITQGRTGAEAVELCNRAMKAIKICV